MDRPVIYTVGHSTHQLDYFLELLKTYKINCLVDVRSVAASSYNPQYNKEPLPGFLKNNGVTYMHFAEEFGARHTEPELLDDEGKVDFEKVRRSRNFQRGVDRLRRGIKKGFTIALMCAESDPFNCHRFSLISVALENDGFNVRHILKDKTMETNAQLESRLLTKFDKQLPRPDMFTSVTPDDRLKAAYRLRNKEIAFSPDEKQSQEKHD
jgi:uncharacterized protein (DUF488 family)